jgi:DNA-binding transcriptional regulator YiaG
MTPIALRQLRRRLGLSQAKFSALVGVASNTVARWERGELGMKPTTARLIELVTAKMKKEKA